MVVSAMVLSSGPCQPDSLKKGVTTHERIGKHTIGAKVGSLPKPARKGTAEKWGADGLMHQDWTYANGLVLNVAWPPGSRGKGEVALIEVTKPGHATRYGVQVGDTRIQVLRAYSACMTRGKRKRPAAEPNILMVGDRYDGLIITLQKDKVVRIFLGAAAE